MSSKLRMCVVTFCQSLVQAVMLFATLLLHHMSVAALREGVGWGVHSRRPLCKCGRKADLKPVLKVSRAKRL
eukprot:758858-Amphidinium_carterae.1